MVWFAFMLWTVRCILDLKAQSKSFPTRPQKNLDTCRREPKKVPFYSYISPNQIQRYQRYLDRALKLSSTLEFKKNDLRFNNLLVKAVSNDSLSELDLETMRLQYIHADKHMRAKHRGCWVETVLNRKNADLFPDPWAIVLAVFAKADSTVMPLRAHAQQK
jgi:hypothetical protein